MEPTKEDAGSTRGIRLCIAVFGIAGVLAGCSTGGLTPVEAIETEPAVVELVTRNCAEDVTAEVVETPEEVTVSGVEGRRLRTEDCQGFVRIMLDAPLGDRDFVVNGNRWVRDGSTGTLVPAP